MHNFNFRKYLNWKSLLQKLVGKTLQKWKLLGRTGQLVLSCPIFCWTESTIENISTFAVLSKQHLGHFSWTVHVANLNMFMRIDVFEELKIYLDNNEEAVIECKMFKFPTCTVDCFGHVNPQSIWIKRHLQWKRSNEQIKNSSPRILSFMQYWCKLDEFGRWRSSQPASQICKTRDFLKLTEFLPQVSLCQRNQGKYDLQEQQSEIWLRNEEYMKFMTSYNGMVISLLLYTYLATRHPKPTQVMSEW